MTDKQQETTQLLMSLAEEYHGNKQPDALNTFTNRIHHLPTRVSDMAGEPLDCSFEFEGDRTDYQMTIEVDGRDSRHNYLSLTCRFNNPKGELNLDPIHTMGLFFYCALNRPDQMPDWVLASLADRGITKLKCDYCPAEFRTWQEATEHEHQAHPEHQAALERYRASAD